MDQDYVEFDGYDGYEYDFGDNSYEDYELPYVVEDAYLEEDWLNEDDYAYEDPTYADCYA